MEIVLESFSPRGVGSQVVVLDAGATFDTYRAWPDIKHVPYFQYGTTPDVGKTYTITYIGKHEFYKDEPLYVLDGAFMVGEGAFTAPE